MQLLTLLPWIERSLQCDSLAMFLPHYTRIRGAQAGEAPEACMLILHGIYGRGGNWRAFARKLAERKQRWEFFLVDLPMHGKSMSAPPPHTLESCARSVLDLIDREVGSEARVLVLGHSFGGKVALDMLRLRPKLGELWIIDSSPAARPDALNDPKNTVVQVLRMLEDLPRDWSSREDFIAAIVARGFARPLALWLAMNLESRNGGYRNTLETDAMRALLRDFFRADRWPVVEAATSPIHFAIATQGSSLSAEDQERLTALSGGAYVSAAHVGGSHWLHVDGLDELVALVAGETGTGDAG